MVSASIRNRQKALRLLNSRFLHWSLKVDKLIQACFFFGEWRKFFFITLFWKRVLLSALHLEWAETRALSHGTYHTWSGLFTGDLGSNLDLAGKRQVNPRKPKSSGACAPYLTLEVEYFVTCSPSLYISLQSMRSSQGFSLLRSSTSETMARELITQNICTLVAEIAEHWPISLLIYRLLRWWSGTLLMKFSSLLNSEGIFRWRRRWFRAQHMRILFIFRVLLRAFCLLKSSPTLVREPLGTAKCVEFSLER